MVYCTQIWKIKQTIQREYVKIKSINKHIPLKKDE